MTTDKPMSTDQPIPHDQPITGHPPVGTGAPAREPVLEIADLSVDFRLDTTTVHAVRGVSLSLAQGETLAVVGESGSGKTATALSVLRLNPQPPCVYAGGRVLFDGRDLLTLPEKELGRIRGQDIAMVFQDPMTSLDPLRRVGAQVAEVLRHHQGMSARRRAPRPSRRWTRSAFPTPNAGSGSTRTSSPAVCGSA